MSGNNSDSEGSLSDWELVQQGDLQDVGPATDSEGNSSGSEFVHLDDTVVSYHHRPSQERELVEIGDNDLADLSHETLQASPPATEVILLKDVVSTPTSQPNPEDEMGQAPLEVEEQEQDSLPESDLTSPTADPLGVETTVALQPISEQDDDALTSSRLEDLPAVSDVPEEDTADKRDTAGSDTSDPSEPELLDLSDAKATDSESEVEILIPSSSIEQDEAECIAEDSSAKFESPLSSDQVESPDSPESECDQSPEASTSLRSQPVPVDEDEPGASFLAGGTPHEYLQSLVRDGRKADLEEQDEADGSPAAESEQGAEADEAGAEEEEGIQVLREGDEKSDMPQGEAESSDDDTNKASKENSVERDNMNASGSSVSSRFSFIHRDRRSDDESLPESDISLIDDSDLSNQDQVGDLVSLFDPVRIRQYKHNPNTSLNTILSLIMGAVLALGIGIGIGHAFGSSRELLFKHHHEDPFMQSEGEHIRKLRQTLQTCATKRDDMEARLYEYQQGKLSVILEELHTRVGHLEKENKRLKNVIQEKTVYMEQVSNANEDMKSRVEDMHNNLSNLTVTLDEIKSKKTLLEGRHQDERDANAELRKNLTDVKLELDEINEHKRMTEIEKNTEISDLQGRLIDVGTELEDVKQHKQQLVQSHETLAVQLNGAKNNLDELSRSKGDIEHHSAVLLKELKTRLNTLLVENMDLKAEVARLRYRQHPANPDQMAQYKEKVNTLKMENEELQNAVSKSRYTQGTEDPDVSKRLLKENQQLEQKVKDLSDSLAVEQNRSDMWHALFISERDGKNSTRDKEEKNFMDCMKIVFSQINVTEFTSIFNDSNSKNLTKVFMQKVHFVFNATKNVNFSDYVSKKWDAIYNFSQSAEFKDAFRYAESGYENVQDILVMKWKEFQNYTNSDNFQKHVNHTKDIISQMKDTVDKTISKVQNLSNSDHVKEYINKTKETMSKLSVQIKETWSRLRNISSDLYKSHKPKVRKVQDDVTNTLFEFGKTIKDRFGELGDEVRARFKRGKKQKCRGDDCHNRDDKWKNAEKERRKEKHDERSEKKNEANCKKVNKKFNDLKNIVESLTKKRWYRIDNSDREEILEEFDEYNNRYLRMEQGLICLDGDDVIWLNCQISWWRASLSGSLDKQLQRSCGSSFARWQIKVTKKHVKGLSRKKKNVGKVHILITPEMKDTAETKQKESQNEPPKTEEEEDAKDNSTFVYEPTEAEEDAARPSERKSGKEKENWFLKRGEEREDSRHDPKWYFRRMEDREDGRHDAKWMFKRAEDRANLHKKNLRDQEEGTYGCTKRRGESGFTIPCHQNNEKDLPDDVPGQQNSFFDFDNVFYDHGKDDFYDEDWNDPDVWRGY